MRRRFRGAMPVALAMCSVLLTGCGALIGTVAGLAVSNPQVYYPDAQYPDAHPEAFVLVRRVEVAPGEADAFTECVRNEFDKVVHSYPHPIATRFALADGFRVVSQGTQERVPYVTADARHNGRAEMFERKLWNHPSLWLGRSTSGEREAFDRCAQRFAAT